MHAGWLLSWLFVWSEVQTCTWPKLMPLPLTVSCFSKTFLVLADLSSPGQRMVKQDGVVCMQIVANSKCKTEYHLLDIFKSRRYDTSHGHSNVCNSLSHSTKEKQYC